jgi:hypothetical protein
VTGTQCNSHLELVLASGRACEQKVRDVRTGDEQYDRNDSHQYEERTLVPKPQS